MGAQWAPHQKFGFCPKKIIPEARWAYHFSVKWKNKRKFMGNLPMLFFVSNGRFKKKKQWAHDGRGAHEIKKNFMGVSKKKTMGIAPFFESPFFQAHDPGIPIRHVRSSSGQYDYYSHHLI